MDTRPTLLRRNRNFIVRLLTAAFLFAQFGLIAHASTHIKADPHGTPAAQLCGECLAGAPLQNMVGGAPAVVLAVRAPNNRIFDSATFESIPSAAFTAFRSRAPPILL